MVDPGLVPGPVHVPGHHRRAAFTRAGRTGEPTGPGAIRWYLQRPVALQTQIDQVVSTPIAGICNRTGLDLGNALATGAAGAGPAWVALAMGAAAADPASVGPAFAGSSNLRGNDTIL